ncbi:MAG TPA: hypothetical protein VN643_00315 [Pyrinomonadaceae bacterium]|nr:hypothetical protein [Pyrinomonadaceae bacterium]
MADGFQGQFDGKDKPTNTKVRIRLDTETADVIVGGGGIGGDIKVNDDAGVNKIRLNAGGKEPLTTLDTVSENILLAGDTGTISLIRTEALGNRRVPGIRLSAQGDVSLGVKDVGDLIWLRNKDGKERTRLDAESGNIWLGGNGVNGDLMLFPGAQAGAYESNHATIHLDADGGKIFLGNPKITKDGKLEAINTTVHLNGTHGNIKAGGDGTEGDLQLTNANGDTCIHLSAGGGEPSVTTSVYLDGLKGNVELGCVGHGGDLIIKNSSGDTKIHLDGEAGDITLKNNDCAEDFDLFESKALQPGTVVVLDDEGAIRQSQKAYDRRVAGVLSGAGSAKPALVLDRRPSTKMRQPVALLGKVYCNVDAQYSPIDVGDLLTTSPTPGHAMKADDPARAFGAVIGKALLPLSSGQGLIPILVALQ